MSTLATQPTPFLARVILAYQAIVRRQVKLFEWQPITADNLPKMGDEVGAYNQPAYGRAPFWIVRGVEPFCAEDTADQWLSYGWTHRRPINPPRSK